MLIARRKDQAKYPQAWDELVGAWYPGAGPSGTRLYDLSGRERHATLTNGPTWVDGRAISSADSDDHITANLGSTLEAPYTISAWLNVRVISGADQTQFLQTTSQEFGFDAAGRFNTRRNGGYNAENGGLAITAGRLCHVCVTMTAAKVVAYYVDGRYGMTGNPNMSAFTVSIPASIRMISNGLSSRVFDGLLYEMEIYRRSLPFDEVRILAQRPGIIFEPKRRVFYSIPASVKAWLFRRQSQIIGGGLG